MAGSDVWEIISAPPAGESLEIWSSAQQRQGCPDTSARGDDWIGTGEHAVVRTQKKRRYATPVGWARVHWSGGTRTSAAPCHVARTSADQVVVAAGSQAARRSFQKKKPLGAGRAAARLLAAQITGRNEVPAAPKPCLVFLS